jgi:hypothetical protein
MLGNITRSRLPCGRHARLTDYSLFANGTAVIETGQFAKTVSMNRMPTRQVLWRLATRKHVFSAHGTIVLVLILEALMLFKHAD